MKISGATPQHERDSPAIHGTLPGRRLAQAARVETKRVDGLRLFASSQPIEHFRHVLRRLTVRRVFVGLPKLRAPEPANQFLAIRARCWPPHIRKSCPHSGDRTYVAVLRQPVRHDDAAILS